MRMNKRRYHLPLNGLKRPKIKLMIKIVYTQKKKKKKKKETQSDSVVKIKTPTGEIKNMVVYYVHCRWNEETPSASEIVRECM